jgi:phospholipase C
MYFEDMHTAANKKNVYDMDEFFTHVANGDLPQFVVLQPQTSPHAGTLPSWQHPDAPVSEGERLYKKIYESLRASKVWNDTLFMITYDEHGGFYDHVAPPQTGVPPPDGVVAPNGFKFDRLGIRIPTLAISPLIPAKTVVHQPPKAQSPFPSSQYDATSIMSTVNKIFGIKDHMHARDAWSGTFEHLFTLDTPRDDCPMTLPDVPPTPAHLIERQYQLPLNEHLEIQVEFFCKFNNHPPEENCGKNIKNQYEAGLFIVDEVKKFLGEFHPSVRNAKVNNVVKENEDF